MNADALLNGIRDANFNEEGIRCLKLFNFDENYFKELQADVERLCRTESGSNVGEVTHITNWTRPRGEVVQFSLLNASGRYDDFRTDHDMSCFGKRFYGASRYPSIAKIIALLPHVVNCRVNLMGPGAALSPHKEHTVILTRGGSVALRTRFHLPVFTNVDAELMLDGEIFSLEAGVVYFVNHGCVHSASNGGVENRIHLVWDTLLTREAFDFFFEETASPQPLRRLAPKEQIPTPVRKERIGPYERIAPLVTPDQATQIGWCEVQ
jgi:aspartyl/asparaginyl beta-hydroxylase